MALNPYALIDGDDITRDAISSLPIAVEDYEDAVDQAIADITAVIEDYLQRQLIVRKYTELLPFPKWRIREWIPDSVEAYTRAWPPLQILQVKDQDGEDVTDLYQEHVETWKRHRMIMTDQIRTCTVTYIAGYRRKIGVTLAQVKLYPDDTTELEDLTVLPPVLPASIRAVATELVLHRLTLASNQQLGIGQRVQGIADLDVALDSPQRSYVIQQLRTIDEHRYLV